MGDSAHKINTINFSDLQNWSVLSHIVNVTYQSKYPLVRIGSVLKRTKESIEIQDDINYKRATIKINNGGIYLRDIVAGRNIGTKNQYVIHEGQLLLSKIDARNGAFGIVPKELEGGIITGNFWVFEIDTKQILPQILCNLLSSQGFRSVWEICSNGTTNRHYLQESAFLNTKIPVPGIDEQNEILKDYFKKLENANTQKEIGGNSGLERLEIKLTDINKSNGMFQTANFSDFNNRWETNLNLLSVKKIIEQGKYSIKKLGSFIKIKSAPWKKDSDDDVKYIEISNIDSNFYYVGGSKSINRKNAPSRASQVVSEGDLIFGTTRPYLNNIAIITKEYDGAVCSSGFIIIEPCELYDLRYIKYMLASSICHVQYEWLMTGALYPALTNAAFKEIIIPLPDLQTQQEIADDCEKFTTSSFSKMKLSVALIEQARQDFENAIFE